MRGRAIARVFDKLVFRLVLRLLRWSWLAVRLAYRLPGRRLRRKYMFPNDTILTIRIPDLG